MSRRALNISLFALGLVSILSQVIVLRELTISFYGNEFFIGIVLAAWLAWVALGSAVPRRPGSRWMLFALQIVAVVLLFLEIFAIRYIKGATGFPGEIPNLLFAFFVAILSPAPLCFVLGMWWSIASELVASASQRASLAVGRGYFMETLGFILGGVLFSFLLVRLPSFMVASLVAVAVAALATLWSSRMWLRPLVLIAVVAAGVLLHPAIQSLESMSTAFRFKHQRILETVDSPFGQLTVTRMGEQRNFYESGLLIGSDRDEWAAEELVHLPMLQHPDPKSVMLLGGGWSGALNEILKHGASEVHYLELDPTLIALADRYLPPIMKKDLADQRVHLVYDDGYHFLKNTVREFDVIIVNLPDPSTALLNRYYTEEFFRLAGSRLTADGVLSTHLSFAPDQPTATLVDLNASVLSGLEKVFPNVMALPEESVFFLASMGPGLTRDPEVIAGRYEERDLGNRFITEDYLRYRLTTDRIAQAEKLFAEREGARANREFWPVAYYYQSLFWLDHFYPKISRAFAGIARKFWPIAIAAIIVLTLVAGRRRSSVRTPILSVATAGFSLMAAEIVVIFLYQTVVGFLYYRLALLIAALMAGMALGVWLANRRLESKAVTEGTLVKLHIVLAIFCAFLFAASTQLGALPLAFAEVALLVLAELAGMFGAMVFPVANHLYLETQLEPQRRTGIIYGADVAGSAVGAMLPSIVLIPLYGVWQTLLFVGLVNLWMIGILTRRRPRL
jgi:spermidine synthase